MNFIRDIISEKRRAKPEGMPVPPIPVDDHSAVRAQSEASRPTQPLVDLSEHGIAAPELNIFAADEAEGTEDQSLNNALDAWVNAVDPATVVSDSPEADAGLGAQDDLDVSDREAGRPAAHGALYLDAGSVRGTRQESPFERLKTLEAKRHESNVKRQSDLLVREPGEEKRLRLAMTADAPNDIEPIAPVFSIAAGETNTSQTEEPALQRTLNEMPFVRVHQTDRSKEIVTDAGLQVPPPAAGRGSNRSGRVKTRLLGFSPDGLGLTNPFEKEESRTNDAFPVGWLVVVSGPGRGASFPLHDGVARIGRGEDQTVCLNFGDNSISRENHLSVAFDSEQNAFFIGQSGRSNIVRLNNKPLLSTEQVGTGDQIRVGETTLRLVALCGENFSWAAST